MHAYCNNKLGVILLGNVTISGLETYHLTLLHHSCYQVVVDTLGVGSVALIQIAPFMLPSCCWYIGGGLCCINIAIYPILLRYRGDPRCIPTVRAECQYVLNVTSIWFGDIPSYSIAPFMLPSCCWYIGGGLCCINIAIYPILLNNRGDLRCMPTVIRAGVILLGNVTSIWLGDIPSYSIAPFMLPSCCWYIGGGLCCINIAIYPILLRYRSDPRCIPTVRAESQYVLIMMWQVSGLETYHLTLLHHSCYQVVVDILGVGSVALI